MYAWKSSNKTNEKTMIKPLMLWGDLYYRFVISSQSNASACVALED